MASDPRIAKKSSMGRQKIEIKKVEQSNKRHVTFSKRKLGLFRKATELSILCQAEIAVIVFSQSGRLYASGHPDPDSVIYRYLSGGSSSSTLNPTEQNPEAATLSQQYEEAVNQLEAEKQCLKMMTEIQAAGCGHGFWWDQGIEDMGLEEIEQFKECLEELKQNLVAAAEEKEKARLMKSSMPETPPEFSYLSLLNGDGSEDQALDYWMGTDSGSSMAPYLGHCD